MESKDLEEKYGDSTNSLGEEQESTSEKERSDESHHERVARVIEQNRAKERSDKVQKKKFKVLTVLCPYKDCHRPVQLLCPYCKAGALECDDHTLAMVCNNCQNTLRHLPCPHCRFIIKPSYIYDRQHNMKQIMSRADASKFSATLVTFVLGLFILWSIVYFST